ncbi:MAG: hypothetical protein ACP5OG_05870, partial [Candidatus Nanoarchaeia archaeon]
MNKKSMAKIGAASIAVIIIGIIIAIIFIPKSSNADVIGKEEYKLGEKVRIDCEGIGDYKLRIITPSTSYIKEGKDGAIFFNPAEAGDYELTITSEKENRKYYFKVLEESEIQNEISYEILNETNTEKENKNLQVNSFNALDSEDKEANATLLINKSLSEDAEDYQNIIGKPIKKIIKLDIGGGTLRTKVSVPYESFNITVYKVNAKERKAIEYQIKEDIIDYVKEIIGINEKTIIISNAIGDIEVEYYLPAAETTEKNISQYSKQVKVYSPEINYKGSSEEHIYNNITAYTNIKEEVNTIKKNFIKVYWVENKSYIDFNAIDSDDNGLIDKIEWNVPHLSTQTFLIIIQITNAEHLDTNKNFISDIYEQVREKDDIWSETINENEYVRIKFERELTNINDITIYPRVISGNPKVEVYQIGQEEKIAEFSNIVSNEYSKIYLKNLTNSQDSFDLRVVEGKIEFDLIIDPTAYPGGSTQLRPQACRAQ